MATCTRPLHGQVSQYFNMDGEEAHEPPLLTEDAMRDRVCSFRCNPWWDNDGSVNDNPIAM